MLRLTDSQLDEWIASNGLLQSFTRYSDAELQTIRKFAAFKRCVFDSHTRYLGKPWSYGAFAKWLDQCDAETMVKDAVLAQKLNSPNAPKLYFVPGRGLQDVPF